MTPNEIALEMIRHRSSDNVQMTQTEVDYCNSNAHRIAIDELGAFVDINGVLFLITCTDAHDRTNGAPVGKPRIVTL